MKDTSFDFAASLGRAVHDARLSNPEAARVFAVAFGMYVIKVGLSESDAKAQEFLEHFMQELSVIVPGVTVTIQRTVPP
jgi:hypothetical protein